MITCLLWCPHISFHVISETVINHYIQISAGKDIVIILYLDVNLSCKTGSQLKLLNEKKKKLPNDFHFNICFHFCQRNLYLILASCNQWGSLKWYVVVVVQLCSVAKSCPTPWPHGLMHAKLLCPPLSHRVCSNSCLSRQWCYQTISSSDTPFSFCLQAFSASVFSNESALHIK